MTAFSHSTAFLLGAALLISCAAAAPAPSAEEELAQSQAIDLPNESAGNRCYYNFQHYEEGDRIVTNEPCLNCTCHKRMLMCYLRVCPFTKAVGQDCTVEKRPDQCCPVITCPQVPVDVLTSSTTTEATSTAVGHLSNYGCTLEDNTFYPDGVQMPSDPRKPCELCYCIRNHTACVRQECTLNVEGCRPVYQEGVCCPVRYDCDYNEISTEQPSTFGGGLLLSSTASPLQCRFGDTLYNDGELIESDKPCESCYCMRGDIVCAVRSCGEPLAGKECEAVPPPEGQCCPTSYKCANGTIPVEALGTESSIIMHTTEIETQEPSKEPEVSTEGVSNPEVLEAKPEATSTSQEENPENIEAGTPEENELHVVPENVESDPLNVDELEEENTLHEASQNSDAKPSDATEKPSALSEDEQTSAPVTETEPQEVDIATTAPVAEESDAVQPSEGDQTQVSPDSQDVPIEQDNLEQQHLPVVTDLPQPEDHSEINTDNKVEESESTPSVSTEGGFLETPTKEESNSDSQAQANVEPKPVEDEADEVATLNPANEIQPEKGDIVPETLDQVKYPESNVESEPVSVTSQENNVKADAKPDEGVPLAPSSSEGEAVLETTETLTPVNNESTKKEPVPPRKEDAAIEEPHPTQHAEGSATKADDSVPTDLSYTGAETPETSDEVESNPETEGQTIANINPTQTSDAEVFDHENEAVHENVDVQTESPASESPEIASSEHSPEEHFDASPSGSVSDEKESNPTTDEIKPLENAAIEGDNLSSQGESVPNVVVTESELPTEKVPEESNADKEIPLKTPSETSDDSNVEEDVLGLVTEKPESQPTEIQPDVEHLSTDSKTTGAGAHENSEQSEDKIVLETTSTPASDTPSNDDESSTKENEIGDVSGETLIPAKQEVSSPTENVASSTDKIEHTINAERDQTETEENEINSEQTDVKIDNNDAVKDTQTESNENQETTIGSDTLIKVGSGSQPETEDKQTQENALPSESKPDETQPLQPEATPAQETETNEFQVVEHDPTDLENSDFEEQELVDNEHHIHDGVSSENEIIDGDHQIHGGSVALKPSPILPGPAGIPGEGDCLVDGKTYSNNSEIPSKSRCHKVCTCLSSIVHCQGIDCEPPPPHLADCMPVHHADLCCPVYTCDGSSNESPDAGSQILTGPGGDNHEPAPTSSDNTPTLGNSGEEAVPILTSGPAVEEAVPEATALTPEHSDDGENSHPEDIKQPETSGDNSEETPEGSDSETPHHNEGPSQDVEGHSTESKLENADPQKPSEDVADSEIQTQSPQSSDTGEKIPEVNSVSEAVTASNEEVAENPPEGTNHPATVQEITSDSPTVVEEHLSSQSEESNVDSQSTIATDTIIEEGAKPAEADILEEEEVTSASIETGSDEKGTEASNSNENSPEGHTGRPAIDHIEDDSVPATVSPAESEDVKMPIEELYEDVTGTNSPPEPIVASEDVSPEHPAHDDSSEVDHDVPGQESESHKDDVQQEPSAESFTELPNAESDHSENPMNGIESEQPQTTDVNEEQPANENEVDTVTHSVVLGPEFDPTKVADDYESNKEDFADNEKEIVPVTELHVEEEDGVHVSSEESQTVQPTLEADSHQEEASVVSYDHDDSHEMETDTDSNQTIETNDTVVAEEHEDQKPETSDTENESETHSSDTLNIETTQSSTISSSESVQDQVGNEIETINEEHTANTVSNSGHSTVVPDEEVDISTKGPDISEPSESISAEENIVKLPEVELDDLTNVGHDNEPVNEENTVKLSEVESDVLTNEGQDNEPVIEHQETTQESVIPLEESASNNPVDESSDQTSHSTEEAHSDKEENVVSETEIPVVEPVDSENPAQESEPVIIPDLPLEHEQPDHETLQPTQDVTSEPLEESEDEHVEPVAPESEFEETAKPEEIEPSYQGNSHDVPAATDEPAQEEEKPTHGEDNKEEQASVPSYEEEATSEVDPTHHDSEKATQTEETPTSEVNPTHHDSQQETQPVEEPNSEVDPTHHDSEPPAQTDENPTSEVDPTHHTPESAPQTEEDSHIPDHPAPEHPTEDESILSNIAEGLEDELKPSLPVDPDSPTEDQFPTNPADIDYDVNEDGAFGPGTCRYGGKVYVSAQQIPRDDPCDFCFCFRSDIICLQQSCPPPIHRCHQEPIQGYCCPRYQCPVSMATSLNLTTTTTTTTTTLPPHFFAHAYHGAARQAGCLHKGRAYSVGEEITSASGPCLRCMCGSDGQMKCDPVVCSPEPMLRKMMEAAISHRRR